MAQAAPPISPPAPVHASDNNPLARVHFRLWQIVMTALTILVTGWIFHLSVIAGIIALFFAKHFLVAVLAAGLRLPPKPAEGPSAPPGQP